MVMLLTSAFGIVANLVMLFVLGHGHSHGDGDDHGHSHGGGEDHGHSHAKTKPTGVSPKDRKKSLLGHSHKESGAIKFADDSNRSTDREHVHSHDNQNIHSKSLKIIGLSSTHVDDQKNEGN